MSTRAKALTTAAQMAVEDASSKLEDAHVALRKIFDLSKASDESVLRHLIKHKGVGWICAVSSNILHECSHDPNNRLSANGLRKNAEVLMTASENIGWS